MKSIKKAAKLIGKIALGASLMGIGYSAVMLGAEEYCSMNSKKIENESQLELKINEIRQELDIPKHVIISGTIYDKGLDVIRMVSWDYYLIYLNKKYADECAVKHELAHVKNDDIKERMKIENKYIKNAVIWFWQEPRAIAYEVFGWKF